MGKLQDIAAAFLGLPTSEQVTELNSQVDRLLKEKSSKSGPPVASGVEIDWGKYQYEKNKKLASGTAKWSEIAAMLNDPAITSALRNCELPLRKAQWEVKPASDDPRDVEIAEFVAANLYRQPSDKFGREFFCRSSWKTQRLPEILDMLSAGFSMFVKTTKVVEGKIVFDRIKWLEPASVDPSGWKLNEFDEIKHVERTYKDPEDRYHHMKPLNPEQIALYVHDLKGARFEGRAFTRPMWGGYTRKSFIQRMAAIWAQKNGAPAPYGLMPSSWSADEKLRFIEFIEANRGTTPAENYFVGELGEDGQEAKVGYAGVEAQLDRGYKLQIDSENNEIARAGGNKASMLGENATGNKSLGESQGLFEMVLVEALAETICEWETNGVENLVGLVEELVSWNYSDVKKLPEIVCVGVNPFEQREAREAKVEGWKAGIIPKTPDARRQIVEGDYGLDLPDDAYEVEEPPPMIPGQVPPGVDPAEGAEDDPLKKAKKQADEMLAKEKAKQANAEVTLETPDGFRERMEKWLVDVPTGPGRNRLETDVVKLALVDKSFREGERDVLALLRGTKTAMIEDLMERFRAGKVTPKTIKSQRNSVFKGQARVKREMTAVLKRVAGEGQEHVSDELDRMREAEDGE